VNYIAAMMQSKKSIKSGSEIMEHKTIFMANHSSQWITRIGAINVSVFWRYYFQIFLRVLT